jgi:hypothetical protein
MACQKRANWQKISSKVHDKWQSKYLGMPIYASFGSPLFLMLRLNNVLNGNIVFHGRQSEWKEFTTRYVFSSFFSKTKRLAKLMVKAFRVPLPH